MKIVLQIFRKDTLLEADVLPDESFFPSLITSHPNQLDNKILLLIQVIFLILLIKDYDLVNSLYCLNCKGPNMHF